MSRRERRSFVLFVTILATLVTSLSTSPLIFLWQTHLAGFHGSDAFAHTWSLWWFDRALSCLGQSPAWVNFISYPIPFHHPIFVAASYARLVTLPLVHWGGPVVAYNAHLFVSFVSTWVLMALLCVELTGNRAAAVVGGAIFAFCPNRIVHALHGHFTQTLTYFWPLMVLCLWRLLKRPGIGRGVVFGLTLILACSVDLMPAAYFAIPVVAGVWLFFLLDDRTRVISRAGLRGLAAAFSVAAAVLVPIMWPLLSSARCIYRRPAEAEEAMAELESLARPGGDPRALADYGIGYVVLHCDFLESADLEALTAHLAGRLGPPVYEDERIVAFAVPGALEVAPPPLEVDQ
jgi:hypothetical protein